MPAVTAPSAVRAAPIILAFDTAGLACSVAVVHGGSVLAVERQEMRHGHSEALLPMIDAAMRKAGLAASDLTMVATTVGPGGFTGIRTGLAAAQGIAVATGAELVGVTVFDAICEIVLAEQRHALLVALESRRSELYVQGFADAAEISPPLALLPTDLPRWIRKTWAVAPRAIAGDAAERALAALGDAGPAGIPASIAARTLPEAVGVARAAARRWRAGPAIPARPLYLRPPDVTLPRTSAASGSS